MEKVGLKGAFEEEKYGEEIRTREKSHEEDTFLIQILPYIGEYSVRNKHKKRRSAELHYAVFSVLKETLYFRQKRDVMSSNVPSAHRRSIR